MKKLEYFYGEVNLVTEASELPSFGGVTNLYLDVETNSGFRSQAGFYPYRKEQDIAGIAFCRDDEKTLWYVPVKHKYSQYDLPKDKVREWINTELPKVKRWVNHNIKFDAHFLWTKLGYYPGDIEMICTLTLAKIAYADRLSHDLKTLCKEWCKLDINQVDKIKKYLKAEKTKNYGDIPPELLAVYAAEDVYMNRHLYKWLDEKIPSDLNNIRDIEKKITPVFFDMEAKGLRFDPKQVEKEQERVITELLQISQMIKDAVGIEFKDSPECMHDILINRLRLPIVAYTDKNNPSFDKNAFKEYLNLPQVVNDQNVGKVVKGIARHRKLYKYFSSYLEAFDRCDDNYIHPKYNQIVRTGRTSSSEPNIQNQTSQSKLLILPDPGMDICASDASQVELRWIVHYIKAINLIEAYKNDPSLDMHSWVANEVGCARSPAKNINFAIAYGAGRTKITSMVATNDEIITEVRNKHGDVDDLYSFAHARARHIMTLYDDTFPTLKPTADRAAKNVRLRRSGRKLGYTVNAFGRRRHLPDFKAHIAFNTIIQGTAMDYIKTRMIALSPRYNSFMKDHGIMQRANVHDENMFQGPHGVFDDPTVKQHILDTQSECPIPCRVPFYWDYYTSDKSWGHAK